MGDFDIDERLIHDVFHLPSGDYEMSRRSTAMEIFLPYLTVGQRKVKCLDIDRCTNKIWVDRFEFLRKLFCIRNSMPLYFLDFVEAEGKNKNWNDAFWWFFKEEIHRNRCSARKQTNIGIHISLLLAHIHSQKTAKRYVRNQPHVTSNVMLQRRPRKRRQTYSNYQELSSDTDEETLDSEDEASSGIPVKTLSDGKNSDPEVQQGEDEEREATLNDGKNSDSKEEAEQQQGEDEELEAAQHVLETYRDALGNIQIGNPFLSADDKEEEILRCIEIGRSKLVRRFKELRDEREFWKSEPQKYSLVEAELRAENDSVETDKEKWKGAFEKCAECMELLRKEKNSLKNKNESLKSELERLSGQLMKAEEAGVELEKPVTIVQASKFFGTTKTTCKQATPVSEDKTSFGAPNKKRKMENRGDSFASS